MSSSDVCSIDAILPPLCKANTIKSGNQYFGKPPKGTEDDYEIKAI